MINHDTIANTLWRQMAIAILWPSFVSAGIALVVLYIVIDPLLVAKVLNFPNADRISIYSISFIFFWLQAILANVFCLVFIAPIDRANRQHRCNNQRQRNDV